MFSINKLVPLSLKITCRSISIAVACLSILFIPIRPEFMKIDLFDKIKLDGQILLCSRCAFNFLEILPIKLTFLILWAVTTWICLTRYKLISSSHRPCRQHYNTHWYAAMISESETMIAIVSDSECKSEFALICFHTASNTIPTHCLASQFQTLWYFTLVDLQLPQAVFTPNLLVMQ